jgi:ribosome-binding protein aMBF1 (putative translation factor)
VSHKDSLHNPFASSSTDARTRGRLRKLPEERDNPISRFIREERAARGWTQEDMAREADVGIRQLKLIERGHLSVTVTTISKILAVLGKILIPGDPEQS